MKYLYIFENASATSVFHYSFCHDNLLPACLWDTPHAQSVSNKGLEALLFYTHTEAIQYPQTTTMRVTSLPYFQCYVILIYVYRLYVLFFLDELRKFTITYFPKQTHLGYTLITLFFPTPFNQSTHHQNVFVLAALAQAIG